MSLAQIGFDPFVEAQLDALEGGRVPARIAIAHGEGYVSWTGDGVRRGRARRPSNGRVANARRPARKVGDWVAGTYSESAGALVIEHLLARRTMPRAAGRRARAGLRSSRPTSTSWAS